MFSLGAVYSVKAKADDFSHIFYFKLAKTQNLFKLNILIMNSICFKTDKGPSLTDLTFI